MTKRTKKKAAKPKTPPALSAEDIQLMAYGDLESDICDARRLSKACREFWQVATYESVGDLASDEINLSMETLLDALQSLTAGIQQKFYAVRGKSS